MNTNNTTEPSEGDVREIRGRFRMAFKEYKESKEKLKSFQSKIQEIDEAIKSLSLQIKDMLKRDEGESDQHFNQKLSEGIQSTFSKDLIASALDTILEAEKMLEKDHDFQIFEPQLKRAKAVFNILKEIWG